MGKIGLLYAPAKGRTEKVAHIIQQKIGESKVELILIDENTEKNVLNDYDRIIFGISTVGRDSWDANYTAVGWDFFMPKLEDFDFSGKTVAIFGLGDHILYSNNFVDAMGILAKLVITGGAKLVGKCVPDDYTFEDSEAVENGVFLGLPIDEDNEEELTEQRINNWLQKITTDLGF